jgi:hypothetical protein
MASNLKLKTELHTSLNHYAWEYVTITLNTNQSQYPKELVPMVQKKFFTETSTKTNHQTTYLQDNAINYMNFVSNIGERNIMMQLDQNM